MQHTGPISCVAGYGTYVVTGGYDNRVILWDARTQTPLAKGMHDHLVNHCSFSADGLWLVSCGSDYSARIWSLPDLRLRTVLSGHGDDVDMAVFSPDNQYVATCALDRAVRIFDCDGRCLQTFWGHTGNIISILWSDGGRRLVSSGVDGTVREWDIVSGKALLCHDLDGVRTDSIVVDECERIIAGDDRGRIAVIEQGRIRYFAAHQAGIKKLVYCPQRRILASLSYDRTLAFWTLDSDGVPQEWQRTDIPAMIWSRAAAMLPGHTLALGTFGSTYALYDWQNGQWHTEGVQIGPGINALVWHEAHVYCVGDAGIVRRDGQEIVRLNSLCNFIVPTEGRWFAGGQLGQLFDVELGVSVYQHHAPLNCAAMFYRAGIAHLAVGTYSGEMLIFSLAAGRVELVQELVVYENAIKSIVTSGDYLFSVCASTDVAWHDIESLALQKKLCKAHDKIANACCALGEQGFASVGRDRMLRLWWRDTHEVYPSPHPNSIKCMTVSSDGNTLMTGSYGGTLAGFDVPTRSWTVFQRPTMAGISSLTYDKQAGRFLAASYDGRVYPVAH
jgi:toxoflavin biosynthesis protein ToxC